LVNTLRAEDAALISPIQTTESGLEIDPKFIQYITPPKCYNLIDDLCLTNQVRPFYKTKTVNAAIWLMPTATIKRFGLFDPLFFHYGEDIEFLYRLQYHNAKIGISPLARAVHARINTSPSPKTIYSTFCKKTNEYYVEFGLHLRDPNYPLRISAGIATERFSANLFKAMIAIHFLEMCCVIFGFVKVCYNIPKIIKHRQMTTKQGLHFA
jgi:GT2 family glycosyltransferase